MGLNLNSVGYYSSPRGGAPQSAGVPARTFLFEMITAGIVYAPSGERCEAGTVFAHQPGQETIWRSDRDEHYECLTVRYQIGDSEGEGAHDFWPRQFIWEDVQGALSFAHEMLAGYHHDGADRSIMGDYMWQTFRLRLDQYERERSPRAIPLRMQRVLAYIQSYFAQDVSVEELANLVDLSPSHLHTQFKKALGMSPHQYLIGERMRVACHLLVSRVDAIQDIAKEVGYRNTETFCRAFKQQFGSTAAQYRKRYTLYGLTD